MNFQLAKTGQSFKGAFAYYLHDKSPDAGPKLESSARVSWTENLNLAVDDPTYAQSVMIATARNADQIKKDAGIKATGRKATAGPVFAYSIAWQPDKETVPDRAGMMTAVKDTLKVLGAEGYQTVVIAHQDTAHPHVHIVINRVDPNTGKMLVLHKNADKLDAWAAKYERDRGEIVSPNRAKKHEEKAQREAERAAAPVQAFAAAAVKVAPAKQPEPPRPKTKTALLAEAGAAQKVRHKQEWSDLATANKARRAAVYGEKIDFKAIAAQHRADTWPMWSELGKQESQARRAFHRNEGDLFGIVANAVDFARHRLKTHGIDAGQGILSLTFGFVLSRQARVAAFQEAWCGEKAALKARTDTALQGKFAEAKTAQAAKLAAVRKTYDTDRAALIARQDLERAQIRDGWRKIYTEREALEAAQQRNRDRAQQRGPQNYRHGRRLDRPTWRSATDSQAQAPGQPKPALQQGNPPVKPSFDRSAGNAPVAPSPVAPEMRVSVAMPAPAPVPDGVPQPPARRVESVPAVDRAAAYAQTPEGRQVAAGQAQKPVPDALRRSFQPPPVEKVAPAKESTTSTPSQLWKQAAPPASPATPARSLWKSNADEITTQRPEQTPDRKPRPRR